ncbi:LPS export ABC transporter permease LptF [Thioclava indica]|uniref:LPS export ABC transporter permease LptF n=1 Tax=Thioclava indica TaxID=1353528 RepID=UPI00057104C0|nr:LPS export ABC transporter permease LptF [Thioclava indica]
MTRLDRYLLSKLMALFGFFALVLVSVYWVNRAVLLFDSLISDGQTALVVLEFTALTLPYVIRIVLPVAAFAATIYAVNRLDQDSELVVMRATGASNWRLARSVVVFGLIASVMMAALVNVLVPAAKERLAERRQEVAQDVSARFLTEGSFQHPATGVTIYIRKISELGELEDLFLADRRNPARATTYTADKALIVRSDSGPKLVMLNGMAQTLQQPGDRLAITRFANFTYDIGALLQSNSNRKRALDEIGTLELMRAGSQLSALTGATPDQIRLEVTRRISQPLLAPIAALIGFAAMMIGTFSRFGMWRQITLAILGLIAVQALQNSVESVTTRDPSLWPLLYLPALGGGLIACAMLWWSQRPWRVRGARAVAEGGA